LDGLASAAVGVNENIDLAFDRVLLRLSGLMAIHSQQMCPIIGCIDLH